jgi:hypothetical protein
MRLPTPINKKRKQEDDVGHMGKGAATKYYVDF